MNLPQKAGASSAHSKRCRAVSTLRRLAKRLECARLAGAFRVLGPDALSKFEVDALHEPDPVTPNFQAVSLPVGKPALLADSLSLDPMPTRTAHA